MAGLLSKERIVAGPGFNRWLVPPAALAIHLSIGQAYAFSVFKLPLTKVIGISQSAPGDWKQTQLAWIFTIAIVFLGLSAAVFGRWLEHAGPRKSGVVAACCWGLGFFISALGVSLHNIWLIYLGYGVLGGCGLGLGYITPVSTLIKWFPDRRGMATGMAIMGFGGGALIASPLSQLLLDRYKSATSVGVAETFVTLGTIYLVTMLSGAFLFRVPAPGWRPTGWLPPTPNARGLITHRQVHVDDAIKTVSFYLLWAVLFLNVTAGIGILEQASPMIQEMFKGRVRADAAAGFVGLLSLFNMAGRFGWSSLSDRIGRKATYAAVPFTGTRSVPHPSLRGTYRQRGALRGSRGVDPDDVRRGVRHHSGLPVGHLRHSIRRRHSRAAANRMVRRWSGRPGSGQLHPGVPDRARHSSRPGLQHHDVSHGGPAGDRVSLQSGGATGSRPVLHGRRSADRPSDGPLALALHRYRSI